MVEPGLRERVLVWLLRLAGCITLLAFPAILLPVEWMKVTHAWLGLGEFPAAPVTDYLARSIAALYGFHGVLVLIVSRDVRRYRPIVAFIGVMNLVFGVIVLVIDLRAGMPLPWTIGEGPPVMAFGVVILWLVRSLPRSASGA